MTTISQRTGRFTLLAALSLLFFGVSFVTRTVLVVTSWRMLDPSLALLAKVYAVGMLYDLVTFSYAAIALVLYLVLVPDRVFRSRFHGPVLYAGTFLMIHLYLVIEISEYLFFAEFGSRFNFIAVDYLIYTEEILNNIRESYPVGSLFLGATLTSLLLLLAVKPWISSTVRAQTSFAGRVKAGLALLLLPAVSFCCVDGSFAAVSANRYANELATNGIYNLFAAFGKNEIPYQQFYASIDDRRCFEDLRKLLAERGASFVSDDVFDITREIRPSEAPKRLNVVVIVVESLSARFLGVFGNQEHLTPNLDRLAGESLLFTNLHATGTRTDRGLESITLSIPPTPGRSLVKRPGNENLFSWGALMKDQGYAVSFLYSGFGYFDNMNYFFSHNGFQTTDRASLSRDEITFANAWGVCDEDLYRRCIREFDASYAKKAPFFSLVLTTSNHRPYSYPDGRIDIPSHTGRKGAVKYTDYALGEFFLAAREKPWFHDTLFVIVADHCANSAGKVELPVKKYEIPLLIYAPAHIAPQRIDVLASQMDIAPTVLGLLNISYQSRFMGKDILGMMPEDERACIGTYERLGYLKKDTLVILDPGKRDSVFRIDRGAGNAWKASPEPCLTEEAISYYQDADYLWRHHLNRWKQREWVAQRFPGE